MAKTSFFPKLRTAAALIFVFVLIYGTNRLDNHHFENVQHIINTVYEDRIVAQHYIYQLNNLYRRKEEGIPGSLKEEAARDINRQIDNYFELFSATRLTNKEARVFQLLEEKNEELKALEARLASLPDSDPGEKDIDRIKAKIDGIYESLDGLSEIQLNEGGRLRQAAQDSLDTNSFFSQLELVALLFTALLVQIIIFYVPKSN
ncbi:MAG: hypothetical protein H6559_30315 [Lewinellaceae bacterium]|nr:hypothetical protein [Lewinellaceae bacterium]